MATSLHVKEKSAWKTVSIPQDLLSQEEFDGLVDIQELTDYELLSVNTEDAEITSKKSKNRKRKRLSEVTSSGDELECTQHISNLPSKKKKKKQTGKSKVESNIETDEEMDQTLQLQPELKKKAKLKKKKTIISGDLAKTNEKENLKLQQVIKTEENEVSQKKKKKKKKKKLNSKNHDSNVSCGNSTASEVTDEVENHTEVDMSQWKNLYVPDVFLKALQEQRFENPTKIQTIALPSAIRDRKDILGAAETGSGKTLAFGIPLLAKILDYIESNKNVNEGLEGDIDKDDNSDVDMEDNSDEEKKEKSPKKRRKTNPPLALILEPTRELAVQVKNHLTAVAKYTDINFATIVGGMSVDKQRRILSRRPEVVIATPGRLWQLIEEDNEHLKRIDQVICLVVDEADRMVEKGHYEELTKLFEMINKSPRRAVNRQTFVMSATLTMDVALPKRLMNKKKVKKDDTKLKSLTDKISFGFKPKVIDLTPKEKVSTTLTELRVNCASNEKDFYLYYFVCQHPGRTLVFVNSKDCLRRMLALFTMLQRSPLALHADMHQRQRLKNLDKFSENKKGLLFASDVAARGLDIPKVDHVIHYQVPRTMENYVHRSGRTARASNLGLSVMLVSPEDARDYRKIIHGVRNGEELPIMPVDMELMPAVKQRVDLARQIDVKEYRLKKKRLKNNFFTKAAQEMDMIIDDKALLEDLGDSAEQARDRNLLKQMKAQLAAALRGSLMPLRMSKYPTKSGQLSIHTAVNLFNIK
ncbi:ATP-dependent RNA helicase DDX24-like [Physella acuta]|uniref:ATP-dependent RNA helicase DDX24-like n=1 Tax=Physella acuta TaxID=109671 RepID=UPI0027DBFDD0|nr:ATP-dependent RNA helicase DDX24-like [Physella acuta]